MNEDEAEAVRSLLDPLLRALEMLLFVSRNLHPPYFEELMASVGTPDEELKSALARPLQWPQHPPDIGTLLGAACDAALGAFAGLRKTLQQSGDVRDVYRALRLLPKGLEALYPLAAILPPVSRFFLDPSLRSDDAVQARFLGAPAQNDTGVMQFGEKERGGSGSMFRRTMCATARGRLSWRCMAAAEPGASFSGAGCAMRAAMAPLWWRRHRSAAPGH